MKPAPASGHGWRLLAAGVTLAGALAARINAGAPPDPLPAGASAQLTTAASPPCRTLSLIFTRDGKWLVRASLEGFRVWDATTGKEARRFADESGRVAGMNLSPNGQMLAVASNEPGVSLWDVAAGKRLRRLISHHGGVRTVAFSPDGKTLASGGEDQTIRLWDVAAGTELRRLEGPRQPVAALAFSTDGTLLASGSNEFCIRLWDVARGQEIRQLRGHQNRVQCLVFSPDGRTLASASRDSTIRLWDFASGQAVGQLAGYYGEVRSIAFSPDGRTVAAACSEPALAVWEILTGKERGDYHGQSGAGLAVAFSPDGRALASSSDDGTAFTWDVTGLRHAEPLARGPGGRQRLELSWGDLASKDAMAAYRATWRLAAAADVSVPYMRAQIDAELDRAQRIERLIADLDDDHFEVRERAMRVLEIRGKDAERALRQELTGQPSLEVRYRVEELLRVLESSELRPASLRLRRAVEVLERIGSPEAARVLRRLTEVRTMPELSAEAHAALQRLARRPAAAP